MSKDKILDCGRYIYLPGRALAGYAIKFSPESLLKVGILSELTSILASYNVPILFLSLSRPDVGVPLSALLFVDLTDSRINEEDLREKMSRVEGVEEIDFIKPLFDGMLVDVHFEKLSMGSRRAVLFREPLYKALIKETVKQLGSGGFALLYHIGLFMGKSVYEDYVNMIGREDPELLLEVSKAFYKMTGLGVIEHIYVDLEKKEALIRVYDSFECSLYKGEKKPVSSLVRGIFAGWFGKLFKADMEVKEVKCIAVGDDYCEFLVKAKS